MSMHDHPISGRLREMTREECLESLRAEVVGRIGFNDDVGPVVLPVNYVFRDGSVVIATGFESSIARFAVGEVVALEVQDLDPLTETGWTVLVRGETEVVPHDDLPDISLPRPWAGGQRPLLIRIAPAILTGRWLLEG